MSGFIVGSIVQLTTNNSPDMVVSYVNQVDGTAVVKWFNGGWPTYEVASATFPNACLRLKEDNAKQSGVSKQDTGQLTS